MKKVNVMFDEDVNEAAPVVNETPSQDASDLDALTTRVDSLENQLEEAQKTLDTLKEKFASLRL